MANAVLAAKIQAAGFTADNVVSARQRRRHADHHRRQPRLVHDITGPPPGPGRAGIAPAGLFKMPRQYGRDRQPRTSAPSSMAQQEYHKTRPGGAERRPSSSSTVG